MASTVVRDSRTGNRRYIEILFTAANPVAEHEIDGMPDKYTVVRYMTTLESGAGATVDPALGVVEGFSAGDFAEVGSDIVGAPAARVATVAPNPIESEPGGSLYVQPRADAGVDNVIRVGISIVDGWLV